MGERFKLVSVFPRSEGSALSLQSTHPEVLDWIFAEVKRWVPSAHMREDRLYKPAYGITIDRLQGKDEEVGRRIVTFLSDNGFKTLDYCNFSRREVI